MEKKLQFSNSKFVAEVTRLRVFRHDEPELWQVRLRELGNFPPTEFAFCDLHSPSSL
jgi:hypothetical protein